MYAMMTSTMRMKYVTCYNQEARKMIFSLRLAMMLTVKKLS